MSDGSDAGKIAPSGCQSVKGRPVPLVPLSLHVRCVSQRTPECADGAPIHLSKPYGSRPARCG
jgi:hypothetical protein